MRKLPKNDKRAGGMMRLAFIFKGYGREIRRANVRRYGRRERGPLSRL